MVKSLTIGLVDDGVATWNPVSDGNLLVTGGAGCGKTWWLTHTLIPGLNEMGQRVYMFDGYVDRGYTKPVQGVIPVNDPTSILEEPDSFLIIDHVNPGLEDDSALMETVRESDARIPIILSVQLVPDREQWSAWAELDIMVPSLRPSAVPHTTASRSVVRSPVSGWGCPVFQCREEPPPPFGLSLLSLYARSDIIGIMSQKVVIERVQVRGAAPYLGMSATPDGQQVPLYSTNPDVVMRWLCDGWRCRYNQLRSRRTKWDRESQTAVPLNGRPDMRSDRQARLECSWLTAMPAMVLQSPNRIENTDWWSANKRRRTLKKKHRNPGMMPRFKSRHDDLYFVCWRNKGSNANYRRLNRHHGEVVITGQNPGEYRLDGQPCRYSIHIRVRVSQPIRDYTSIGVNWTRRTLVFVNDPLPIGRERTGAMVGLDRGCAHTLATSDNRFLDLPKQRLERIDREIRRRQKAQARRVNMSGKTVREYRRNPSRTYERTGREISRLYAKAHRIIDDWQHKTTTMLVHDYDLIALEDLNLQGMSRKSKAKPDPDRPGAFLPNGQSAKRGLNRSLRAASLAGIVSKLEYKTRLTGQNRLILVNPAYTSQTCSECGYCDSRNRESQADFECKQCHMSMNADLNAANNILKRGLDHLIGLDEAEHAETESAVQPAYRGKNASTMTCETSTR